MRAGYRIHTVSTSDTSIQKMGFFSLFFFNFIFILHFVLFFSKKKIQFLLLLFSIFQFFNFIWVLGYIF